MMEPTSNDAADRWQTESTKLPSFYSPRSRPAASEAGGPSHDDVSGGEEMLLERDPAPAPRTHSARLLAEVENEDSAPLQGAFAGHNPDHIHNHENRPPLPSLLSPAFTPPSTPGTSTPNASILGSSASLIPRGVPVDSSVPTGGCGNKRPRLLETLPNVQCLVRARIPTVIPSSGTSTQMFLHLYANDVDNKEHLAIVFGNNIRSRSLDAPRPGETEMDRMIRGAYTGVLYPGRTSSSTHGGDAGGPKPQGEEEQNNASRDGAAQAEPPLVRIHSECYTGETAWSARCDCGEQLDEAARLMSLPSASSSGGIIIYLRQEGRGIGLGEKLKAYNLQDLGSDTVEANLLLRHPADARSYGLATAILRDLGQREIRLLTNNPDKIRAVEGPNREVVVTERVAMIPLSWRGKGGFWSMEVEGYLKTKIEKMGHMLDANAIPR